jgi:2-oxo-3-hexenedioate decarboxylase
MNAGSAMSEPGLVEAISAEVIEALDSHYQISPLSGREPGLDFCVAYAVTARVLELRTSRGEKPVGRKLGFTNRNIWDEYKVYAPIWSYMYDTTVRNIDPSGAEFEFSSVVEPRIEPEITLSLKRAPEPGMNEAALLDCLDWVAHGFEVVQSLFPGWKFQAADTVAAFGLHGALMLGPKHAVTAANSGEWLERLTSFEVKLSRNGAVVDAGHARNVLGGPLSALRNVVDVLAQDKFNAPLAAGECITTGTVTRAFPIAPGEVWTTDFSGAPFEGLHLRIV